MGRQPEPFLHRGKNFTAAGMHNPAGDLLACDPSRSQRLGEDGGSVFAGEFWNMTCQNISQHPISLLEFEVIAVSRTQRCARAFQLNTSVSWVRLACQHRGAGSVAK